MANKKILFVDDDRELVGLLKERLSANGYDVVTACDGNQGFEIAKRESPDLIISDVVMPEKDGWTFARELKADEDTRHIPMIMLTCNEMLKDVFELEGVNEYVTKPFEPEDLLLKIKKCLADKQ